ncbi:MAG: hypothetical protein AAFY06_00045 [Pseudomonadota bacterium]
MNKDDKKRLTHAVKRLAEINAERKELNAEAKEIRDAAKESMELSPKVLTQLAKEQAFTPHERDAQLALEEALDNCRSALGMLSDTPLGEAAMEGVTAH